MIRRKNASKPMALRACVDANQAGVVEFVSAALNPFLECTVEFEYPRRRKNVESCTGNWTNKSFH